MTKKTHGMLSDILEYGTKAKRVGAGIHFTTATGRHKRIVQSSYFSNFSFDTVRYNNKTYQVDDKSLN